jgi:hypothetical protein
MTTTIDTTALYQIIILSLATGAIAVTISKAQVFASTREWIMKHNTWLGRLVSCSYCTSHWVAIFFVICYRPALIQRWIVLDLIVSVFVIVTLAAIVSGVISKLTHFRVDDQEDQNIKTPD